MRLNDQTVILSDNQCVSYRSGSLNFLSEVWVGFSDLMSLKYCHQGTFKASFAAESSLSEQGEDEGEANEPGT